MVTITVGNSATVPNPTKQFANFKPEITISHTIDDDAAMQAVDKAICALQALVDYHLESYIRNTIANAEKLRILGGVVARMPDGHDEVRY